MDELNDSFWNLEFSANQKDTLWLVPDKLEMYEDTNNENFEKEFNILCTDMTEVHNNGLRIYIHEFRNHGVCDVIGGEVRIFLTSQKSSTNLTYLCLVVGGITFTVCIYIEPA